MPKFKFGEHVPNNPAHAIKLDNINQDRLWANVIENKLGSINDFETLSKMIMNLYLMDTNVFHIV